MHHQGSTIPQSPSLPQNLSQYRASTKPRPNNHVRQSMSPPPPHRTNDQTTSNSIPPVPPLPEQIYIGKHRQMPSGPRAVPKPHFRSVSNSLDSIEGNTNNTTNASGNNKTPSEHFQPGVPKSSSSRSISSSYLPPKSTTATKKDNISPPKPRIPSSSIPPRLQPPPASTKAAPTNSARPLPRKQSNSDFHFPLPHVPASASKSNLSNQNYRQSLIHAHEFNSTPNLKDYSNEDKYTNLSSPQRPLNRPAHVHPQQPQYPHYYYVADSPQKRQQPKYSSQEDDLENSANTATHPVTRTRSKSTAAKQNQQAHQQWNVNDPINFNPPQVISSPKGGKNSVAATRRFLVSSPFSKSSSEQNTPTMSNNSSDGFDLAFDTTTATTTSGSLSIPQDSEEDPEIIEMMSKLVTTKPDDSSSKTRGPQPSDSTLPLAKNSMTPALATKNFKLNLYEKGEILDFRKVYFCGRPDAKKISGDIKRSVNNYGFDDDKGDYKVVSGDHLAYRYEILGVLGKGSFGKVLKCVDHKSGKLVAVKMIINRKRFHMQALVEADILKSLAKGDPDDRYRLIRYTDHFNFRDHLCISTELLGINLYELIKYNGFKGLPLKLVKSFTKQILEGLEFLASKSIIHCDLKPENVLISDTENGKVKIIDFGSSCYESERVYTYIQSRFYRSPEVILGMAYNEQIDIWSLGCIVSELLTGRPLFMGENEHEQIACVMEIFGVPDKAMISRCTRRKLFFDSMGNPRPNTINGQSASNTTTQSISKKKRYPNTRTLEQELKNSDQILVDFLTNFLAWNPKRRITAKKALQHEFITGVHNNTNYSSPVPYPPQQYNLPTPQMATTPENLKQHRYSGGGYKASPRQMKLRSTPNLTLVNGK